MMDMMKYGPDGLKRAIPEVFEMARRAESIDRFRQEMARYVYVMRYETEGGHDAYNEGRMIRIRDCAYAVNQIFSRCSEEKAGFSVAGAIMDLSADLPRPDLSDAFYADLLHLFLGLQGKGPMTRYADSHLMSSELEGRPAAIERSLQLDALSDGVSARMAHYSHGLDEKSVERRVLRREHILKVLGAGVHEWNDWRWQYRNVLRDPEIIEQLVTLSSEERAAIKKAKQNRIPFGITPHYLSLMDDDPSSGRDRSIRAQVIPPVTYLDQLSAYAPSERSCLDFMLESDTSPVDLITRRYPSICIFKPFNTCPQICVYCQRNWEIEDAMMPGALASDEKIRKAVQWIADHPAIHEVLITGGDPLGMGDADVDRIVGMVAAIPSVERIRIGTRTPVTAPMRFTDELVDILAKYRRLGSLQMALVTHIQHAYELTFETAAAVEKLRTKGIQVFNQLVYTFFVSRRFEAAFLRRTLARVGVEPYYSFNTKGKEETVEYRVPIARLLQEQKEEARILPGLTRTDEAVYNVPKMGKNYLRARQHRDLLSILPDGARVFEFHPWEKNITRAISTHIGHDVPILDYLRRLEALGEDPEDYGTIWYYF